MIAAPRPKGRLHRSTWVAAGIATLLVLLVNVRGRSLSLANFVPEYEWLRYKLEDTGEFGGRGILEHGWPLVYLSVLRFVRGISIGSIAQGAGFLAAQRGTCCGSAAPGWPATWCRRHSAGGDCRRRSWRRGRLKASRGCSSSISSELFVLTTLVAIVLGWLVKPSRKNGFREGIRGRREAPEEATVCIGGRVGRHGSAPRRSRPLSPLRPGRFDYCPARIPVTSSKRQTGEARSAAGL